MQSPTHRQSKSSWSLKQCVKIAVALVALSQVSIAEACSPSTVTVRYEEMYDEFCYRKACSTSHLMVGTMQLEVRNHYNKNFYYQTPNGRNSWNDIRKQCSDDGIFCVDFRGANDATLFYANKSFRLGKPSVLKGTPHQGEAHYWTCL
ncbi:hypothetical protein BGZ73_002984 [Actinomortierella ambigua]|nr:hypothetical protein BGZ73_002984 [Actinomortierella ambigua]